MDQQKLRTFVFDKTGVRIDIDDPVFALVALNEAVLAEAVERHVALLDQASAGLAEQAAALLENGSVCRFSAAAAAKPSSHEKRVMAIAFGAAVLCALLVLAGQALLFKAPPAPAPTVIAKELTPEQALAIRNGEKLEKIVRTLDQKTRNAIQAEMQKP